ETRFRCKPDNFVYNNMLYVLCKKESSGEFIDFSLMIFRRIESPDTYSYSNVLVGLCKFGRFETAIEIFKEMCEAGLVPTRAFVIIRLIAELCRLGKMEEGFEILKVVEERKLNCVEEGYSTVIQALCEHRLVEEASHLFGRMLSQGLKPKLIVYNSVICMLCKMGRIGEAERVFEIMNKKRCLPDNVTYNSLVHAYSEARNWEIA
ncbi:PPR domain-containing protein/PPR_1 domain-containing protein/PPR_2 domain-containing protein, partial [Cephalotus follicularis]